LQNMLDYAKSDPEFLNIVTTGDDSWPGNHGAAATVETFNILKAKKGQTSVEQRQSDIDHFLWLPWCGASWVHSTRPKH
jgi:hypothetical protein